MPARPIRLLLPLILPLILASAFACPSTFAQDEKPAPSAGASAPAAKSDAQSAPPVAPNAAAVRIAMRNVEYHLTDQIIVHISTLDGRMIPKPGQIPVFDDKNSFGLSVDGARVTMNMTALTNDLNDYVFAEPDAPLKKLSASAQGEELTIKGLLAARLLRFFNRSL